MRVVKSNGKIEEFQPNKLTDSLVRVGAEQNEAEEITRLIKTQLKDLTPTWIIYLKAKELLKKLDHSYASRYSLKKAMLRLGPSGYPFEHFFADLLRFYGYETYVDVIENGECIPHEIDVLALKENHVVSIECKYHSNSSRSTDSKVAMYVNSRFKDLENTLTKKYKKTKFEGWLVTNTRLTQEAKRFSRCYGFKAIGWRYPEDGGLERMIEEKHLFPVTVLIGIRQELLKKLLENGIVLVRQFLATNNEFLMNLGFSNKKIKQLKQQAQALLTPIS